MVHALMVCSDESCAAELETAATLEELDVVACECGCVLQLIAVSEVEFVEPVFEWEYELPLAA